MNTSPLPEGIRLDFVNNGNRGTQVEMGGGGFSLPGSGGHLLPSVA